MQKAIAIDFDGTLCTNDYPNIGEPNWEIIAEAKMEQANGAGLILWTCREGEMLDAALKACEEWELHFDVVKACRLGKKNMEITRGKLEHPNIGMIAPFGYGMDVLSIQRI